jgi:hypothetical protein
MDIFVGVDTFFVRENQVSKWNNKLQKLFKNSNKLPVLIFNAMQERYPAT